MSSRVRVFDGKAGIFLFITCVFHSNILSRVRFHNTKNNIEVLHDLKTLENHCVILVAGMNGESSADFVESLGKQY